MKTVNIYTDGACAGNQSDENIGGWGCVLEFMGREKELCGGEINTTNNRMELTALAEALSALKESGLELRVPSDFGAARGTGCSVRKKDGAVVIDRLEAFSYCFICVDIPD